jgi:UDP:flavonoid glycosyltransferase YjiC (YdhE family)
VADILVIDRLMGGPVNRFRKSVGLGPVKGLFADWFHSPDRVIGLFPAWFFSPPGDWPRQTVLTGFPLYDESEVTPMEDRLEKFLDAGEAPIAFTPGSAMRFGEKFFSVATEICRRMGRRGVLLSRHADHLPGNLPAEVLHVSYAPFSKLLPRSAALMHHGGIGTCAQGMAAGVPQLVTTMAHDQPDNARLLRRLGVAEELRIRKFSAKRGAAALKRLLGSPEVAGNCAAVRAKFCPNDAVAQTADYIERLAPDAGGGIIGGG